jgi:hypothetical protein
MFKFKAEESLVLRYQAHIEHQDTLIFELLIPSLESQSDSEREGLLGEIGRVMTAWGRTELLNYGYVSTYHMWEKQISHIVRNQSNGKVAIRGQDFVSSTKDILKVHFQIVDIEPSTWAGLERARVIVNAYKHGPGKAFQDAMAMCPELFHPDQYSPEFPNLEISEPELKMLISHLRNFYVAIDRNTELDFSNWQKP